MSRRLPLVLGVIIIGLTTWIASLGDLTQSTRHFLVVFAAVFVVYAASVYHILRMRERPRWLVGWIFVVAVVCRVIYLVPPPSLSNDIYRYLWEGRVIAAGKNPFVYPPESPELERLRDDNYKSINHPQLETIYPPLAQAVFWFGASLKPDIRTQKILFTLFDLATIVAIVLLLVARGRDPALSLVYAWSPLVMMEFALSGHMDSVGIFFLTLAALLLQVRKKVLGTVGLALSFLAKYLSMILLPFYICKRRYVAWIVLFLAVVVAGYLPFAGASGKLLSSLRVYGQHWEFNSIVFVGLHRVFENGDRVRIGLFLALAIWSVWRGYRDNDFVRYAFWVVGCALLLSPTVYPWYVTWIVPSLCFYPSRAWLFFSGAVVVSYWVWVNVAATGRWELGAGILLIEYVPFLLLLGFEGYRAWRTTASASRES